MNLILFLCTWPPLAGLAAVRVCDNGKVRRLSSALMPLRMEYKASVLNNAVDKANLLYKICTLVCKFCHSKGILYSCENPFNSFMWKTKHFQSFLRDVPHFETALRHCMFGSTRQKKTRLDGQHEHDSWGIVKDKWATALEKAYPWPLARAIAEAVQEQLNNAGVVFPPLQLEDLDDMARASRAYSGQQTRKALPPMVPEFRLRVTVEGRVPVVQPGSKLQSSVAVPFSCSSSPPCKVIPSGSKTLRAQFDVRDDCVSSSPGEQEVEADPRPLEGSTCGLDLNPVSAEVETDPDPRPLEGSSCGLDPNPSQVEAPKVACAPEVERAAYQLLVQHGPISTEQVRHLVDLARDSDMQRGGRQDPESKGDSSKCFITSAYVFSGMSRVRLTSFDYPCLTAALVRYVVQLDPMHTFTSVALFRDLKALPHADVFNEKGSVNLISPLSVFSGGDLWVADPQGKQVLSVKGIEVSGSILMVSKGTQKFVPQNLHATMPWSGQRDVIVGFTPGRRDSLTKLP